MIDLHTHTKYSDGTDNEIEILKKAEEKGLDYIAITDHNTCEFYNRIKKIDRDAIFSGKIIPGVELNTKILGIPIEVLGYGVDIDIINNSTKKMYLSAEDRNKLEVERLYEKCLKEGIKLSEDFVEKYDAKMYASKYLHKYITSIEENKILIDEDAWENSNIFYRKYMSNPTSKFYVDTNDILPSFEETRNLIKDAGGMIFIPHIYEYRDNAIKILENILENYQIDGIECYYTTFTKEQSDNLLRICKEKELYISGGSDYHGTFKPDVDIAIGKGDLKIPDKILEKWIFKINRCF